MSSYVMSVTVSSAQKKGPYTFWLEITQNIDFRTVTLMLHTGMWAFRSPYYDIATIYCTADEERRWVTEPHFFQEMIIGTH